MAPMTKSDVGIMISNDYELFNYRVSETSLCDKPLRSISFPKGTTIAALFRDAKLVKCHGDITLKLGDILSIIGTDADEPMLNALFSRACRVKNSPQYNGDKIYDASSSMLSLSEQFNFELTSYEKTLTLGDFMSFHIGGYPQPGDIVNLIKVTFVVVKLEGDKISKVGMYMASERAAEFEKKRKQKLEIQRSEHEELLKRRQQAQKQLFDSINDDDEYL